ncbi:glycosyltransferase family 4 protein [bacterium]|nr:glycosyltransferase family 4 protein [bacterium]
MFKNFPKLNSRIRVIYNGVDYHRFRDADGSAFRHELKLKPNQFLFGIVGPVSQHKGVEEFIRAARQVINTHPDAIFVVVGPDRPRAFLDEMKSLVASLELVNSVIFTGFRKDVPEIMSALDILITPSRVEAFGRVLLEAMSAGTPVIASQVGGIPEIISEKNIGILVPPESPDKLSTAILSIMSDQDRRDKIIKIAQNHIKNNFTIEKHTQQIEEVYEHFLAQ